MPRPRKCRRIAINPRVTCFKPQGKPFKDLTEVYLTVDGFEAVRLSDYEGLGMEEGSTRMNVSRHTFGRILSEARRTIAEALVWGQALRIEGGNYEVHGCPLSTNSTAEVYNMTKLAVSSEGPTLEDLVDPRFGRAGGFVLVDTETMSVEYIENGQSQAMAHGAGIQSAERIANAGAQVVLTGYVGPKAFQALSAAGVKVGQDLGEMTVGQAVERFKSGQVTIADRPNK
jgi:predicted DNA-binding protein (UPF0251 family)/predicted Fe-Mo cluster-binding NifX family protein